MKEHTYKSTVEWTGNTGKGTENYNSYERSHSIAIANKPVILGSSDAAFRGDPSKHNPEDLLISSLSTCHMLWYLHFCAVNNIIVESYRDNAEGIMMERESGKGKFKFVALNPEVVVQSEDMIELALELHHKANEYCFIANSVNFPVEHNPRVCTKLP